MIELNKCNNNQINSLIKLGFEDCPSDCSLPLALQWLRSEMNKKMDMFTYCIRTQCGSWEYAFGNKGKGYGFDTYEAAESALLDECLTILENKK